LKDAIEESGSLQTWRPDFSSESVASAGQWFAEQVAVRPHTPGEMKKLQEKSLPGIEVPTEELADRTFSLAFDPGVYVGESLKSSLSASGKEAIP